MKVKVVLFLTTLQLLFSCTVYHNIIEPQQNYSKGYYLIGSILEGKENRSFPVYVEKIKLSWKEITLTKKNIKRLNSDLKDDYKLAINDSLHNYPKFLKIEMADYPTLLSSLKKKINQPVLKTLQNNPKLAMITSLDIYFNDIQTRIIKNASVLYLINPRQGYYAIEALSSDGKKQLIPIEQGLVLKLKTKGFCWELDNRNQPDLVDISDNCRSGSERKIKNLTVIDKTKGLW
ncbi:hypothetical protein [Zunongwangia sp.]|uniref:hypothetical protein n=1 Tax=Zunongwangia sp. TaxID=1965325 RepID=UPI003AA8F424